MVRKGQVGRKRILTAGDIKRRPASLRRPCSFFAKPSCLLRVATKVSFDLLAVRHSNHQPSVVSRVQRRSVLREVVQSFASDATRAS